MIKSDILEIVGNTPMIQMNVEGFHNLNLKAKLEFYNPTGSVKDRAAHYIIKKLLNLKEINKDTTLIESSSGNFGIALSAYCRKFGLKFICVVDPHINRVNEMLIRCNDAQVIKVTEPDENGGYLLNRIRKVNELQKEIANSYWVNQYGNPYNAEAYSETLAEEILAVVDRLDYVFLGISSGGTITGVSSKIKKKFPQAKVIAVDIVGSVIFGHPAKKRFIPGIGSSMVPSILKNAKIDGVVMMDEIGTIQMCHELIKKYNIFAGGSSGSVYGAIKKYFSEKVIEQETHVVTIFPDRGERYGDTIYNEEWVANFIKNQLQRRTDDIFE
ncbi:MAG: 2,3-diaminopropionate biosynthesis protein SbnA [Acidobacteria bacterium]|jgi:cysteine synthase A|nr:2,3-diaminopropionate biosynthesis protein SbnA [Acidobacteriota bacterium]